MNRINKTFLVAAVVGIILALVGSHSVKAATGVAKLTNGFQTLAAGTCAQVPAAGVTTSGRGSILIANLDSARIWCGGSCSPALDLNGFPIDPGEKAEFDQPYTNLGGAVFCLSVAGQTAPNNTRWMEKLP